MAKLTIVNKENATTGEVDLSSSITDVEYHPYIIKEAVVQYRAEVRQGTHSVKARSDVAGSSKKLWRQKGTGNARIGTTRSPLWRGGGIVFGPKPRDYSFSVPKKMRKAALRSVLTSKFQETKLVVVDQLDFEKPSTKQMVEILDVLVEDASTVAIALGDWTKNAWLSGRNIPGVRVLHAENLNVYVALQHEYLIVDKAGLSLLEGALAQ